MGILKKKINLFIDEHFDHLWKLASYIHANPEIAFKEEKAAHALPSYLQEQGSAVKTGITGLDTVFQAVFKRGSGLRVAVFAEYDALKELGHACGHNLTAASALGCAVAVKQVLESNELKGSIEVYGTPVEEDGGGRTIMLKQDVFDGLDAVSLMHPTSAMVRIGGERVSFTNFEMEYFGKGTHVKSHPENGINALDAADLFYQAAGLARQQLRDSTHICCTITESERDIGCIPDYARLEVEIPTMQAEGIETTKQKIINIAESMAPTGGCRASCRKVSGYYGRMPDAVLAKLYKQEVLAFGEPMMEGISNDAGGEDLGDVSHVISACNLYMTLLPEEKIPGHTDQFRELVMPDAGKHYFDISSKAMANSILTPYQNPKLPRQVRGELERRQEEEVHYE